MTGLIFNVRFDASVNNAPAGFKAAVNDAIQFFESTIHDAITINLQVGWGEAGGQTLVSGVLGESLTSGVLYSYQQVKSALAADASSPADASGVAGLPASDPTAGGHFFVASAQAKALGLIAPNAQSVDGAVGFGSSAAYTFDPNNRSVAGAVDFIGTAEHEISEVLGRFSILGGGQEYSILDLYRYSAAGTRALSPGNGAYFSIDNGHTAINTFNGVNGGDLGDWAGATADSFNAFVVAGRAAPVSAGDLTVLDALGYDLGLSPPANLVLSAGSDSGVKGDDITNIATPVITGSGVGGDTVSLFDGSVNIGQAVVASGGSWSITTSRLADGQHALTATQSDAAGDASTASSALVITIKTSAPAPANLALSVNGVTGGSSTSTTRPTIVGSGESGDTVTLRDGSTTVGTATVGGKGQWSVTTSTLSTGAHTLTATETDVAGNVSAASAPFALTITAPAPTAGAPGGGMFRFFFPNGGQPGGPVTIPTQPAGFNPGRFFAPFAPNIGLSFRVESGAPSFAIGIGGDGADDLAYNAAAPSDGGLAGAGLPDPLWPNDNGRFAAWLMYGTSPVVDSLVDTGGVSDWTLRSA